PQRQGAGRLIVASQTRILITPPSPGVSMNIPTDLKYTESHEWVRREEDGSLTVGITEYAQDALGDIVFVELPQVGKEFTAGMYAAVVESVKAASDIYA